MHHNLPHDDHDHGGHDHDMHDHDKHGHSEHDNHARNDYPQDDHAGHAHSQDAGHDHGGVEVHVGHKVGALFFMAAATIIVALIPIYLKKKISSSSNRSRSELLSSLLLCFGAGALLGVTFIHILPDTRGYINDAKELGLITDIDFPLAEVLMCIGFFLIYFIEDMVHGCFGHHHHNNDDIDMAKAKTTARGIDNQGFGGDSDTISTHNDDHSKPRMMKGEYTTVINAITMIGALSIHDIFEGFSIGLAESVRDTWVLAVVMVIHKLVLAFSIGIELLQEGLRLIPYFAAMIVLAIATPIGGGLGIGALSAKNKTAAGIMVPAVLNGLTGGCILFVIFCEIIERERSRPNGSKFRIVSMVLGFALISGLAFLPEHSH